MGNMEYVRGIRDTLNFYMLEGLPFHATQPEIAARCLLEKLEGIEGARLIEVNTCYLMRYLSMEERSAYTVPDIWYITQGQYDNAFNRAKMDVKGAKNDEMPHTLSVKLLDIVQLGVDEMRGAIDETRLQTNLVNYAWA